PGGVPGPQIRAASVWLPHDCSQPSASSRAVEGVNLSALFAQLHMTRESRYSNGPGALAWRPGETSQRVIREVCRDAARQPTSLQLEQWASMLLGAFWERRELADGPWSADLVAVVGEPFLTAIARIGSPAAKVALLALSRLDRGELAPRAR